MKIPKNWLQKLSMLFSAVLIACIVLSEPGYADDTNNSTTSPTTISGTNNYLLSLIAGTTTGMLQLMNQSTAYFESLAEMATSWIATTSPQDPIVTNQYIFANLGQQLTSSEQTQLSTTQSLITQFLQAGSLNTSNPSMPSNADDLTYTILFGQSIVKPQTTTTTSNYSQNIQNYIKNVTGSTLILDQPNPNWPEGKLKTQYTNLYNTLAAIQSYDQYLISGLASLQNNQNLSMQLTTQATSSTWFTQIATEALGLVLRHILMYTSQSFVQITQIVQLQQQQLAVQAMTNSLLLVLVQADVGSQIQQKAMRSGTQNNKNPADQL